MEPHESCEGASGGCINCQVQNGWNCTRDVPSVCTRIPVCNNGFLEAGEHCDNGGDDTDGCYSNCTIDAKYNCIGTLNTLSVCSLKVVCGNSKF